MSPGNNDSLFVPAWHARPANEWEAANTKVDYMTIDVSTSSGGESSVVKIEVPYLSNITPIAVGAEIIAPPNAAIDAWKSIGGDRVSADVASGNKASKRTAVEAEPKLHKAKPKHTADKKQKK